MPSRKDPVREISHVVVYAVFYLAPLMLGFGRLVQDVFGDPDAADAAAARFIGFTTANLAVALFANWLALKIYYERRVTAIGLQWNRASADNLALGFLGGAGAAALILAPALLAGAARDVPAAGGESASGAAVFAIFLFVGSAAEEILVRGFGFQTLIPALGEGISVAVCATLFGLLHLGNPNVSVLGIANTIGFGAVFAYAFLRSRDLWLPIGLHFGWNFTLPLFGANVSGLTINLTGYKMSWSAGALWSGGDYGPEASLLATFVLVLLFLYVRRTPARRQPSPLTDPPVESAVCEPPLSLPS